MKNLITFLIIFSIIISATAIVRSLQEREEIPKQKECLCDESIWLLEIKVLKTMGELEKVNAKLDSLRNEIKQIVTGNYIKMLPQ